MAFTVLIHVCVYLNKLKAGQKRLNLDVMPLAKARGLQAATLIARLKVPTLGEARRFNLLTISRAWCYRRNRNNREWVDAPPGI